MDITIIATLIAILITDNATDCKTALSNTEGFISTILLKNHELPKIAADINGNSTGNRKAFFISTSLIALEINGKANDTGIKTIEIMAAVKNCEGVNGMIIDNGTEDSAIADEIPNNKTGNFHTSATLNLFILPNNLVSPKDIIAKVADIPIAVNILLELTGIINCKTQDESITALDILNNTIGNFCISDNFIPFIPLIILPIEKATIENIALITTPVNNLSKLTGFINCNV